MDGLGMKKNYYSAFEWFDKAATQDFAEAQYSLGIMYREGLAVLKNRKSAIKWFLKASKQGHTGAEQGLNQLLEEESTARSHTYNNPQRRRLG